MVSLRINTNSTCNIDCKHCYYKEKVWFDWKILDIDKAKDIIFQAKKIYWNDLNIVVMWGWEPFLYNNLFKLIEYSSKELWINTSITTNFLLVNEDILLRLKDLNILLNISLEGWEKYNDYIRWDWVFRKVLENIFLAKKIWNRCSINFTLTKNNIKDIPFLVKLLSPIVEYITFSRYIPYFKDKLIEPLSKVDYLLVEKILEKYKNYNLRSRQEQFLSRNINLSKNKNIHISKKFNIFNIKSLYLLPDLNIYPAWNLLDYKLWNLDENSLLDILNNWKLEKLYNPDNLNWNYCSKCFFKYNCLWDRWVAYFYTWNFWGDDVQCPYYTR